MGIEPTTSPLPREYSTTELHQHRFDLFNEPETRFENLERETGLEPATLSLEG